MRSTKGEAISDLPPQLSTSGFTVTELLVVISIIAILASLAFPAISNARRAAHRVICLANLKQIALGWTIAAESDEGRLFYGRTPQEQAGPGFQGTAMQQWMDKSWGMPGHGWVCPAAPVRSDRQQALLQFHARTFKMGSVDAAWQVEGPEDYWWFLARDAPAQHRVGSYAKNDWFGAWWGPPWLSPEVISSYWETPRTDIRAFWYTSQIQRPSDTPLFADAVYVWAVWPMATDFAPTNLRTGQREGKYNPGMSMIALPRHGSRPSAVSENHPSDQRLPGAINLSFFDGHAETVLLEGLWKLYWHRDYVPPGKRPGLR